MAIRDNMDSTGWGIRKGEHCDLGYDNGYWQCSEDDFGGRWCQVADFVVVGSLANRTTVVS
jgi:hypothetical protein